VAPIGCMRGVPSTSTLGASQGVACFISDCEVIIKGVRLKQYSFNFNTTFQVAQLILILSVNISFCWTLVQITMNCFLSSKQIKLGICV